VTQWLRVLAVIGISVACAAGCNVVVPPSGDASVAPSGDTSVAPSASPSQAHGFHWTLEPIDPVIARYNVGDVLPLSGGGYLATAFGHDARILRSTDGSTWTLEAADPNLLAAPPGHISLLASIAEGAGGLVAVGASMLDDASTGDARAWTSKDGAQWRAATVSASFADAEMAGVGAGPDGFVAIGSDGYPGGSTQLPGARGAAAWVSVDGIKWTRARAQPSFANAIMLGVVRTGDGFAAWGEYLPNVDGPPLPPIWTSTDGLSWDRVQRLDVRPMAPWAPISRIVWLAGTLIAVGNRSVDDALGPTQLPAAWRSMDGGRTWRSAPVQVDLPPGSSGDMRDVAADGSTLFAIGRIAEQGRSTAVAVWRSTDLGRSWIQLPGDPAFGSALVNRILAVTGGLVAFGQADDPNALENPNLIWTTRR
jgi:hypothetical protein